jgi:hypothetical protein
MKSPAPNKPGLLTLRLAATNAFDVFRRNPRGGARSWSARRAISAAERSAPAPSTSARQTARRKTSSESGAFIEF